MYQPERFHPFLEEGETIPEYPRGITVSHAAGSAIIPITCPSGERGQSVFLEMKPKGYVRPVKIVEPEAEFTVETMQGAGTLYVQHAGASGYRRVRLRRTRTYTLRHGDAYGYVSRGDEGWVVRDDSNIPFKPRFEQDVTCETAELDGGRVLRAIVRACDDYKP